MPPEIELVERFDYSALNYVIENYDALNLRPQTLKNESLQMLKKFRAACRPNGTIVTKYHQVQGHGRLFADKGLSLQSMTREIRNAIAYPFYDDLDFKNCHPTILLQFCQRKNIECPQLEEYIEKRDDVLDDLSLDKNVAKAAVLAVINGGSSKAGTRGLDKESPWLSPFSEEMRRVREDIVNLEECSPYLNLAKKSSSEKSSKNSSENSTKNSSENSTTSNILGKAVNHLICDKENNALMALREFVESKTSRRVGVLVFDGCMVERDPSRDPDEQRRELLEILDDATEYIYQKTGYRLSIQIKDMTLDKVDVPLSVYRNSIQEERFAGDDASAGQLFLEDLRGVARMCNGDLWVRNGHIWTNNKSLRENILLAKCMGSGILKVNENGDVKRMSSNVPEARRILTASIAMMEDEPKFISQIWDSNIGVICYRNGVYDFRKGQFFLYSNRPDVLPVLQIDRDFPARPPQHVTDELMKRVLLSTLDDREVVKTYLELMARATAGEYTDKQWVIMLGERNSGKGLLQLLNETAFQGYVVTLNGNAFLLQTNASSDAAKSNSWMMACEFSRQAYSNEIKCDATSSKSKVKMDGNTIKYHQSGGDFISARQNYMNERSFRVASKLIMNLNDIPEVTPKDAMTNMILFKFPFKFVTQEEVSTQPFFRVIDDSLKHEISTRDDLIAAYTWLVIDHYKASRVAPCESLRNDTRGYLGDIGDDMILTTRSFKVTGNRKDYVLLSKIKEFAREHEISPQIVKDRLARMGAREDANCFIDGERRGRGFLGVQFVETDLDL